MTKARATAVLSLAAAGFVLAGCGGENDLRSDAYERCARAIQIQLDRTNSDGFADYDDAVVTDNGGLYKVTGYFDAQNGLGKPARFDFTCQLRHDGGSWEVLDATF